MINKNVIDDAINLCSLIHTGTTDNSFNMTNYVDTVKPLLDNFKNTYEGCSPNILFDKHLKEISVQNDFGDNIKSDGFTVRGRRAIHSYFWATLFPVHLTYKLSIQLYILVSEAGIKFGIGYGSDAISDSEGVLFVKNNDLIAQQLFNIIQNNNFIKFFNSEPGNDRLGSEEDAITLNSFEDLQNRWSASSCVIGVFRSNNIPDNAGDIIYDTLNLLAPIFKDIAMIGSVSTLNVINEGSINYSSNNDFDIDPIFLNKIFYGPPGTGKTYNTVNECIRIINNELYINNKNNNNKRELFRTEFNKKLIKDWNSGQGQIAFCTFHQSYSYEDFIEGIKPLRPKVDDLFLKYVIEDGIFKKICQFAKNYPELNYVLVIDEINRGNVSSIFGELITLIETDKRSGAKEEFSVVLPYSKTEFNVPQNLYIIGTMNTADRSIEALDTALRRRFAFKEMPPKPNLIQSEGKLQKMNGKIDNIDIAELLNVINDRIEILIDKDHKIGHSYFLEIDTFDELCHTFKNKVLPLLEEYFFGDLGKISLILGNSFISKTNKSAITFANSNEYDQSTVADLLDREVYHITNSENWSIENFISIYQH
jgi:5-methylcytosine-specific restriction protein B